jgi:hypothetical protein
MMVTKYSEGSMIIGHITMSDLYVVHQWREPSQPVDINDSEVVVCHWCGERDGTILGFDPFGEELGLLEDDETEEWWCDECYQDRLDEI